jgi:HEAT repeat protein
MGFKVDSSFLRFLTMGALGVRRVAAELKELGFEPIELERYCASNKIWATKVKRLRLPDLLCVRTGLRAEVRAKSDLKIRMSDAPANPDRVWDAGARDQDVVALIACANGKEGPQPAERAVYFTARALRDSAHLSKLGPPKSASEGAERDRTWPAVIPSRPGRVISVANDKLVVMMEGDGAPPRKQTYTLGGKHVYVAPGDRFAADITILAGAPSALADLNSHLGDVYNPLDHVTAASPMDRYAAVKALRFRSDLHKPALPALEAALQKEQEIRVALEAAASAAALGSAKGEERIATVLWSEDSTEMSMEAILILTELKTSFAREQLRRAATDEQFTGDERRQAAIWGLGRAGLKSYDDLVPLIGDAEENVAYHAIAAFGPDTPKAVIEKLVAGLAGGDPRIAPAASEALRVIDSPVALETLVEAAQATTGNANWMVATIGRLSPDKVRARLKGTPLLNQLEPMLLLAPGASWLANEETLTDMAFLLKQGL